jgi:hypothetical protein
MPKINWKQMSEPERNELVRHTLLPMLSIARKFTTDERAAMMVYNRLQGGYSIGMWRAASISSAMNGWLVILKQSVDLPNLNDSTPDTFYGHGETLPEAICLAALRAEGIEFENE